VFILEYKIFIGTYYLIIQAMTKLNNKIKGGFMDILKKFFNSLFSSEKSEK